MGVVYQAYDEQLERRVALKFLPVHLTSREDALARFVREAKAAAAIEHPNICTIHEIKHTDDGQTFIVMPAYEGRTLRTLLEGPIAVPKLIQIGKKLARGLEAAHRRGIVHRDIKPGNIFITDDDEAIILDFGLAKLDTESRYTRTGNTVGTLSYMSPEQTRGENVDHRTDIWSLGVVLYEMIGGETPFAREYAAATVYSILNDAPTDPRSLRPDAPSALADLVKWCLAKDPDARPRDMGEVVAALEELSGEEWQNKLVVANRPFLRWSGAIAALITIGVLVHRALEPVMDLGVRADEEVPEFVIAVAPFWGIDEEELKDGLRMQAMVSRNLRDELAGEPAVRVADITSSRPRSHGEARALAVDEGADIILWGEVMEMQGEIEIVPQVTPADEAIGRWGRNSSSSLRRVREFYPGMEMETGETMRSSVLEPDQIGMRRSTADDVSDLALLAAGSYFRAAAQTAPSERRTAIAETGLSILDRIDRPVSRALYEKAMIHEALGNQSLARTLLASAIEAEPEHSDWVLQLGQYYSRQGLYDKAGKTLSEALERFDDPEISLALANAWFNSGRLNDELRVMEEAFRRFPKNEQLRSGLSNVYQRLGEHEKAIALWQEVVASDTASVEDVVNLAFEFLSADRFSQAIEVARSALAMDSLAVEAAAAYQAIAMASYVEGRFEEALSAIESAARLSRSPNYRQQLVDLYALLGRYEEAIEALPDEDVSTRVRYYIELGWIDTALQLLEEEQSSGWNQPGGRARAYLLVGRPEKALELLNDAIGETAAPDPNLFSPLGDAYALLGDLAAAHEAYERITLLVPRSAGSSLNRGWLYLATENWRGAREMFARGVERDPDFAVPTLALALAFRASGALDSARLALERYELVDPNDTAYTSPRAVDLFLGNVSVDAFLAIIQRDEPAGRANLKRAQGLFWVGMLEWVDPDLAGGDTLAWRHRLEEALRAHPAHTFWTETQLMLKHSPVPPVRKAATRR